MPWALWPLVAAETVAGGAVLAGVTRWPAVALFAAFARRAGRRRSRAAGRRALRLPRRARHRLPAVGGTCRRAGRARGVRRRRPAAARARGRRGRRHRGDPAAPRAPRGALDVADEGPELGARVHACAAASASSPPTAAACARASSAGCSGVHRARRGARRAAVARRRACPARRTPSYVDGDGVVSAKGTVNTAAQARDSPRRPPRARPARASSPARPPRRDARRHRPPGEAEAYHFCGHIYTTDSCPHPTGLPRIDAHGLPAARRATATASTTSAG